MSSEVGREVAIISMACRFPRADTLAEFWDVLSQARSCIQQIPPDRWSIEHHYDPGPGTPGKSVSKWGAFLDDVRGFDAGFFDIPEDEAALIDPQHRILLELAHETLESAGYAGERRRGLRTGVFVGISQNSYEEYTKPLLFSSQSTSQNLVVNNLRNLAAGRIAHQFNLTGPNLCIDTACSSSLVALHYARLSLLAGECELALAGGISLNLSATPFVAFSSAGALSPSSCVYFFDDRADGFILGEGGGFVLLRSLEQAQKERDPILAVIKGSAVNSDGRSHGLMAPSPKGQASVIADAYRDASIEPESISYIEAHGTGTRIGDAVEARSLTRFFPQPKEEVDRYVGSVKTNIGHLLSAAGIASVIKVVLALNHQQIPPSLNYEQPRANLKLERSGFKVNTSLVPWNASVPRRAGINGFGFGGTNAHVVLEEAPTPTHSKPENHSSALWMISAASEKALQRATADLSSHVESLSWWDWPSAAYSASTSREPKQWRVALVGYEEVPARLSSVANGQPATDCWAGQVSTRQSPQIAFVFTGSGNSSFGQQLYHEEPTFRRLYEEIAEGWTTNAGPLDGSAKAMVAQIAMAQLLIKWGIVPQAVVGVGPGEIVAAFISGRLALDQVPGLASAWSQIRAKSSITLQLRSNKPSEIGWLSASAGRLIEQREDSIEIVPANVEELQILPIARQLQDFQITHLIEIGPDASLGHELCQMSQRFEKPFHFEAVSSKETITLHDVYCTLGRLWVAGVPIDRLAIEAERETSRAYIPTYPFERREHWVKSSVAHVPVPATTTEADSEYLQWLHEVVWTECPGSAIYSDAKPLAGHIHVLASEYDAGVQLAQHLRSQGCAADVVLLPELKDRLLETTNEHWLVYLDQFGPEKVAQEEMDSDVGAEHLLEAARITLRVPITSRPSGIFVFTAASQRMDGQGSLKPERAMVAGLALALNDEIGIPTQVVDFGSEEGNSSWLSMVSDELERRPDSVIIAWNNGTRYKRDVASIQSYTAHAGRSHTAFREEGVYVITGGAGGVGSAIARSIALDVAPTLVLVGRTPLRKVPEAADLLDKLRWAGAVADYVECDVSSPRQVDALCTRIQEEYGELTGIIHAAGTVRPGRLENKTKDQLKEVMSPKVRGPAILLDAVQRHGLQPEFFVAFSSIVSVIPGFSRGLGDYVAANSYLDAFALSTRASGLKLKTLNWTVWSETGAGTNPILLEHLARHGLKGIGSDEAYKVLRSAVVDERRQLIVVNPDALHRPRVIEAGSKLTDNDPKPLAAPIQATPPSGRDSANLASFDSRSKSTESIQNLLVKLLAKELEVEPEEIEIDRSFTSLALDSMGAIDLVMTLEKEGFGDLPATLFFEHNTIEKLASHLAQLPVVPTSAPRTSEPVSTTDSKAQAAAQEAKELALSPVQLAFYANHRLRPDDVAYAFVRITVQGLLDTERLQRAVDRIVGRHPALRTTFEYSAERRHPTQTIHPEGARRPNPIVEHIGATENLSKLEDEIVNQRLNIGSGEVMRVIVASAEQPDRWHLMLHLHHIAADGWSLSLLAQELWLHYFALLGQEVACPPPPHSDISDYIRMLQQEADGPDREELLAWWRSALAERARSSMELPFDGSGQRHPLNQRALRFSLDESLSGRLQQLAADNELSLFHLLLALYFRCLLQWTGDSNIVIGVAEARRDYPLPDIQRLVGCFADVFPLQLYVEEDEPLLSLARRVRDRWLEVHAHSHLSSIDLMRMLPNDDHGTEPQSVSQASFSFARFPVEFPREMPVEIVDISGRTATAATRLSLVCWEFDNRLHFTWNYPAHLFKEATVSRFADDFAHMAREAVQKPGVVKIPVQPERAAASFLEQIALQWQCHPERIAITTNEYRISYGDLARQVGHWTVMLGEAGIAAGDVVAFLGEPSSEAVIALLTVLRLGATWLPIDPRNPRQRIQYQLETGGARAVVHTAGTKVLAESLKGIAGELIQIEQVASDIVAPPATPVAGDDIAYIIFTSGSTGMPKGVPITYHSLENYLNWASETFEYSLHDVVILVTSLAFDASLRQCLAPLMGGSTLRPVGRHSTTDPRLLSAILSEERISIWSSVPSLWLRLLDYVEQQAEVGQLPAFPDLRLIQLGGEALSSGPVRRWQAHYGDQSQFVNLYGPTEATINATYHFLPAQLDTLGSRVPIGRALPGRVLRVVDERDQLCEPGVTGELLVGGMDLSPGYLQDNDLNERKFASVNGERFFRTGDLVVAQPDGSLVFMGRRDTQVKVRGYRIELEEIEQVLASHPQIRQAAVVFMEEKNEQRLVAFLEINDEALTVEDVRGYAGQQLPEYMLPHRFQVLEELPLMVNGKINRRQLANIARSGPLSILDTDHSTRSRPLGEHELTLAEIWKDVLGVRSVYREDDFFSLGGDSLNMLEVLVALEANGLSVDSVANLYRHRVLADQAAILAPIEPALASSNRTSDREPFQLSPAQTGFLMTRSLSPPLATTWSAYFWLEGDLDVATFDQAVVKLLERHPMLRTVCLPKERPPLQVEVLPKEWSIARYEELEPEILDEPHRLEMEIASRLQEENLHLFDLSRWPLIRMRLCRLRDDCHIWFVAADHFIGDAFSGWIFGAELLQVYDSLTEGGASTLPPLRSSFKDYVPLALEREATIDKATAAFWEHSFREPYVPTTHWHSTKRNEGNGQDTAWLHEVLELENDQFLRLKKRAAERGQTAHDTLLGLFYHRLAILTGESDLVIGTAVAGRDYPLPDLMRIFGSFATLLPIRMNLDQSDSLEDQVRTVSELFGQAYSHKLFPRQIARLASVEVPLNVLTGLQFMFSYMDFEKLRQPKSNHLTIRWDRSQTELQPPRMGTDMVLAGRALGGRLRLTFTSGAHVMSQSQLSDLVADFRDDLTQLLSDWTSTAESLPRSCQLDAALIAYLPPRTDFIRVMDELGIKSNLQDIREILFPHGQPRLLESATSRLGSTATVCVPWFADEIDNVDPDVLVEAIIRAGTIARNAGAKCASLAGMLPSRTRYGFAVLERMNDEADLQITTGHSLTAVTVVKNTANAIRQADFPPNELTVAFLGLGSVGGSVLLLYLAQEEHPRKIVLCDVAASRSRLEDLSEQAYRQLNYTGNIEIAPSQGHTPEEVYRADVIVGASSQPDILDVARLKPGTIVVDDSYPNCFDLSQAIWRMKNRGDVLLVGAGLLDSGPVDRELMLPPGTPADAGRILSYFPSTGSPGCQLESLLEVRHPELPLTHGLVTLESARAYWKAIEALDISAARLHLGTYLIDASLVGQIKEHRGYR